MSTIIIGFSRYRVPFSLLRLGCAVPKPSVMRTFCIGRLYAVPLSSVVTTVPLSSVILIDDYWELAFTLFSIAGKFVAIPGCRVPSFMRLTPCTYDVI